MLSLASAIVISLCVFLLGHKRYVKVPPQNSAIVDAVKTVAIACRENGFQNAKPYVLSNVVGNRKYKIARDARYTDTYVEDVQRGVKSCKVSYRIICTIVTHALTCSHQIFLFFPFYFICWIQIWNNLISQAGEMALHGTPNDSSKT
jgi:POT family proton-dependent oligopeptide transporter